MRGIPGGALFVLLIAAAAHARIPDSDRANVDAVPPPAASPPTAPPPAPDAATTPDAPPATQPVPQAEGSPAAPVEPPSNSTEQPVPPTNTQEAPPDPPEEAQTPEEAPPPEGEQTEEGTPKRFVIIVPRTEPEPPRPDMLDGHLRSGPLLSGPGSLTFIGQHTATAALGGFLITGHAFRFGEAAGGREAMLSGTLLGAGLGFATSAWWQHHHWIGDTTSYFSIVNALIAGMFTVGVVDTFTPSALALSTAALIGTEVGAWSTALFAGGDMRLDDGLFVSTGAAWGLAYAGLLLAMIATSGTEISTKGVVDALLVAPGVGAGILALASTRYKPTTSQILRANAAGAGVGLAVLLISGVILGRFDIPTPYLLSMISAAGAKAAIALIWPDEPRARPAWSRRARPEDGRYRSNWW